MVKKKKKDWGARTGRLRKSKSYKEYRKSRSESPRRRDPSLDSTYVIDYENGDDLEYYSRHSRASRGSRRSKRSDKLRKGKRSSRRSLVEKEEELRSVSEHLNFEFDSVDSESGESVYYDIVDTDESDYEQEQGKEEDKQEVKQEAKQEEEQEDEEKDPSTIPSPLELSAELCKLVFGSKKNSYDERRAAFHSLVALEGWVEMKDSAFFKHFLAYGGMVKVLDFLQKILEEEKEHSLEKEPKEKYRYRVAIEYIRLCSNIIIGICGVDETESDQQDEQNKPIHVSVSPQFLVRVSATIAMDYGGINTMLKASSLCSRFCKKEKSLSDDDAEAALEACEKAWKAIVKTCSCVSDETTNIMIENHFVELWDGGFSAMEAFPLNTSKCADPKTNTSVFLLRADIFRIFSRILVRHSSDFLKEKEGFESDIMTRVLEILSGKVPTKKDDDASVATFDTGISSISMSFVSQNSITGTPEEEAFIEETLVFLHECQTQNLLFRKRKEVAEIVTSAASESSQSNGNDPCDERWCRLCEALLPLCVNGLRKYAVKNKNIRKISVQILNASLCSKSKNDQQQSLLTELTEGTLQALAPCLAPEALEDAEKEEIKAVVRKIAIVIYSVYIGEFGPSGSNQDV